MKRLALVTTIFLAAAMILPSGLRAAEKKGLLVYDSIYGSTVESAYWVKAIIGLEHQLDVKSLTQVITVKPYDYVILGSVTRNEKASKKMYKFIEDNKAELAKKELCFFLNCGDYDETMVLKVPGRDAHLIGGRNYLLDVFKEFPELTFTCIAGFGGRQVMPTMGRIDSMQIWLVGKLAKEGAAWEGHEIWESLVVERVEAFANEVRVKVLGLEPRENVEQFRGYWQSLQPANRSDLKLKKFKPKPFTEKVKSEKLYYSRSRVKGDLQTVIDMLQRWARANGIDLREQVKTSYNRYYHAVKNYNGEEITTHIVPSTMPEDPGTVHISFRCYEKPDARAGVEKDIEAAEKLLWADGRKID